MTTTIGACLGVKNIGKPCAGIGVGRAFAKQKLAKPHARFDEGGQEIACSLLYPCVQVEVIGGAYAPPALMFTANIAVYSVSLWCFTNFE